MNLSRHRRALLATMAALPLAALHKALPANIPLAIELRSQALRDYLE